MTEPMSEPCDGAVFEAMRSRRPDLWAPVYGDPSRARCLDRIDDARVTLLGAGADPGLVDELAEVTVDRVHTCFDLWESTETDPTPASFAFVVPSRLSRFSPEFAGEGNLVFPMAALVDPHTCQVFWSGCCPLVLDRYHEADGRAGVIVGCPLTADIMVDHDLATAFTIARQMVDDAVGFARRRFDPRVVGLGAVLPKLTDLGRSLDHHGLAVTTGHAGTCVLVLDTLSATAPAQDVAVVGVGSIGEAVVRGLLARPEVRTIHLADLDRQRCDGLADRLAVGDRIRVAPSAVEALERAEVTIAATTTPIDLGDAEIDLTGRWIIDDSQPGCFDHRQVEERGGRLVWVVGRDGSADATATRAGFWGSPFDYGGLGPAGVADVWGCEAEAHAIATVGDERDCVTQPVRYEHLVRMRELFAESGTTVGRAQRFGSYLT